MNPHPMRALPPAPVPEYASYTSQGAQVEHHQGGSSHRLYSVRRHRLIGVMVDEAAVTIDHCRGDTYKGHLVESMERIRGKGNCAHRLPSHQ